jgi:hypothetical protein
MLPNTVVHRIDNWSSLLPLEARQGRDRLSRCQGSVHVTCAMSWQVTSVALTGLLSIRFQTSCNAILTQKWAVSVHTCIIHCNRHRLKEVLVARESHVKLEDDLEAQRSAIQHQLHHENIEILAIVEVQLG